MDNIATVLSYYDQKGKSKQKHPSVSCRHSIAHALMFLVHCQTRNTNNPEKMPHRSINVAFERHIHIHDEHVEVGLLLSGCLSLEGLSCSFISLLHLEEQKYADMLSPLMGDAVGVLANGFLFTHTARY